MFKPYGIIPPVVTPLTADGQINEPMLRKMVNFLIEGGVHGLFPLGTTGEFYAFTPEEHLRILQIVVDETKGRVPVYGGAAHITTRGAIRLVEVCQKAGVDAVSVLQHDCQSGGHPNHPVQQPPQDQRAYRAEDRGQAQ